MAYGEIKIDTITFTDGGIDKSVSISGLVQNPTFSGNITVTGTISGNTLQGQTVSGVTVTGTTAAFTSGTFISLTGTTIQGTTATYTTGSFTSLTGATISGTTATYATGTFTSLTGTTTTGVTSSFTTGTFTSLTGTTTTGTTATFASGVFTTQISGATITGNAAAFTTVTGGTATITSGVFASGTAAAPSVSVGTTDNGIYSPGTDQVAVATNGTGRLFVDSAGLVGIGTSSPGTLLAVGSTTIPNSNAYIAFGKRYATTESNFPFIGHGVNADGGNYDLGLGARSANGAIKFFTAGTASDPFNPPNERVRITSAGLVGIGTTSPDELLHVMESSASAATPSVGSVALFERATNAGITIATENTGSSTLFFADSDAPSIGRIAYDHSSNSLQIYTNGSSERARIDSSGRLLVGTSSAFGTTAIQSSGSDGGISIRTNNDAADLVRYQAGANGPFIFQRKSRNAALGSHTIVNSGDSLGGTEYSGSDGTNFIISARIEALVDGTPGVNDMPGRLVFSTTADGSASPTERMRIASTGRFTLNGPYFDVVGGTNRSMAIDNTGVIGYVSSTRASKANINFIENHDWLYQLNPVSFNRRKKDDKGDYSNETYNELEYGLIAEEAEKVAPELCFYDVVDNLPVLRGVHYTQLITPMLKALQQANQRIEQLEQRLADAGIA